MAKEVNEITPMKLYLPVFRCQGHEGLQELCHGRNQLRTLCQLANNALSARRRLHQSAPERRSCMRQAQQCLAVQYTRLILCSWDDMAGRCH